MLHETGTYLDETNTATSDLNKQYQVSSLKNCVKFLQISAARNTIHSDAEQDQGARRRPKRPPIPPPAYSEMKVLWRFTGAATFPRTLTYAQVPQAP
jgi:hypothetical protein